MPPPRCAKCSDECTSSMICSKCKEVNYCSKGCQKEHWRSVHKHMCEPSNPNMVWAIEVLCNKESRHSGDEMNRLQHIRIPKKHHIFDKGEICPVLNACGVPLLIYSPYIHNKECLPVRKSDLSNQAAFTFRIDVHDIRCAVPEPWREIPPGNCIIARSDHRPLTREAAETMLMWAMRILFESIQLPETAGWAPTWQLITPASFQLFSRDYYDVQRKLGRKGFDKLLSPL